VRFSGLYIGASVLTLAATLVAGAGLFRKTQRQARSYPFPVISSDNQRVPSVFTGVGPIAKFRGPRDAPVIRGGCSKRANGSAASKGWTERVQSLLTSVFTVRSVSADSSCGGHYMTADDYDCNAGCGDAGYLWHYSDPGSASYCSGYKFEGTVCEGCREKEVGCNSCGG